MADFKIAYKQTAAIEGGYANDPVDNGGETYKGISRNNFPNWAGWKIIDAIKAQTRATGEVLAEFINQSGAKNEALLKLVENFYLTNFWLPNKLGSIADQDIANELYDTGVNMGAGRAALMLQEALNLCNKNGLAYADIAVDGLIGGVTLSTVTKANRTVLFNTLNALQAERYLEIMRNNKKQEKFWPGWLKRILLK